MAELRNFTDNSYVSPLHQHWPKDKGKHKNKDKDKHKNKDKNKHKNKDKHKHKNKDKDKEKDKVKLKLVLFSSNDPHRTKPVSQKISSQNPNEADLGSTSKETIWGI